MNYPEIINWTGLILIMISFCALAFIQIKMIAKHGVVSSMYGKIEGIDKKALRYALVLMGVGFVCFLISPLL